MGALLSWLRSLFFEQKMDMAILGLQAAGKTSFVHAMTAGQYQEDMIPTVGFNMVKVKKGDVTMKVWDLGGQVKFRKMWDTYCRKVQIIVFVVDSANEKNFPLARQELWNLLQNPNVARTPLLILMNKNDLQEAASPEAIVSALELKQIDDREVVYHSISCKTMNNIDIVLEWLIKYAPKS